MIDKEQFIKAKGLTCPFCGSDCVEGGFVEVDAGKAFQEMGCTDREGKWQDVYRLVHVTPLEKEE